MKLRLNFLCVFLILCVLFSISSVSAIDGNIISDEISSSPQSDLAISEINDNNEIDDDSDNVILSLESDDGDSSEAIGETSENTLGDETSFSFADLADKINTAGDEVEIEGTYVYDDEKDSAYRGGLVISKNNDFIIRGNNLIIDGNNLGILNFTGLNNMVLYNVNIKNCVVNNNNPSLFLNLSTLDYGTFNNNANLNASGFVLKNSSIINNGAIVDMKGSLYDSSLKNENGDFTISAYFSNNDVSNNGGILNISSASMEKGNLTNMAGTIYGPSCYFNNLTLINEGTINFSSNTSGSYLGRSNITNKGEFRIGNYLGENTIENTGIFYSSGSYSSFNNITNNGTFEVVPHENGTSNYFDGCNIENNGNFSIKRNSYSGQNITNFVNNGNLDVNGLNQTAALRIFNISNYGSVNITKANMTLGNLTNYGGNVYMSDVFFNGSQNLKNIEGNVNINNTTMNYANFNNSGTVTSSNSFYYNYLNLTNHEDGTFTSENDKFSSFIRNNGTFHSLNGNFSPGYVNNSGEFTAVNGTYGGTTINNTGHYVVANSSSVPSLTLNNNGTIEFIANTLQGGYYNNPTNDSKIIFKDNTIRGISVNNIQGSIESTNNTYTDSPMSFNNGFGSSISFTDDTINLTRFYNNRNTTISFNGNTVVNNTNITGGNVINEGNSSIQNYSRLIDVNLTNEGSLNISRSYLQAVNASNEGTIYSENNEIYANIGTEGNFSSVNDRYYSTTYNRVPYGNIDNEGMLNLTNAYINNMNVSNTNGSLYSNNSSIYGSSFKNYENGYINVNNSYIAGSNFNNHKGTVDLENDTITSFSGLDSDAYGTYNLVNCNVSTVGMTNNGNVNIENSTVGKVNLYNQNDGNITFNGENNLSEAYVSEGSLINNGDLYCSDVDVVGGTFPGSGVKNNGTMTMEDSTLNSTDVYNDGTLNLEDSNVSDSNIENQGDLNVYGESAIASSDINNNGNISLSDTNVSDTEIKNQGELNVYGGSVEDTKVYNNGGKINAEDSDIASDVVDVDPIVAKDLVMEYGERLYFNATFSDIYGNKLDNVFITFVVNGKNFNVNTDVNGFAKINSLFIPGKYNIEVVNGVAGVSENYTMIVNMHPAKATINKIVESYGARKYLTIKLTDKNGKAIGNVTFTVKFNGKTYKMTTKDDGVAKYKLPVLNVGTYKVTAKASDLKYIIPELKTTIKVNKAKTTVSAKKLTAKFKKSKYFKITIKSKVTKKSAKNVKIKVKVYTGKKYKTYTLKTNKNGVAKLNTKSLKKGTHKVVISSANKNYVISKKSSIKII